MSIYLLCQQNIVLAGGGGDLVGSTVWIFLVVVQKITTQLKLVGSGSIYNLEKVTLNLLPLTSP